jgi:hypothetical protein
LILTLAIMFMPRGIWGLFDRRTRARRKPEPLAEAAPARALQHQSP